MIFIFWMLSFKSTVSLSSFTFIKRLFSSLLSATRVVSSAYLRLLIFLLAILIPACASSSLAFHMMYSACKLNKQDDNIQPWGTPFLIWNQSAVPCRILPVASWPAYRFIGRQVRCSGIPISLRIFHSLLWSTQSKALAQSVKLTKRRSVMPDSLQPYELYSPWGHKEWHDWATFTHWEDLTSASLTTLKSLTV